MNDNFFVGKLGYEHEAQFSNIQDAEKYAIRKSLSEETEAISIWDDNDIVISVVLEGQVFIKKYK